MEEFKPDAGAVERRKRAEGVTPEEVATFIGDEAVALDEDNPPPSPPLDADGDETNLVEVNNDVDAGDVPNLDADKDDDEEETVDAAFEGDAIVFVVLGVDIPPAGDGEEEGLPIIFC